VIYTAKLAAVVTNKEAVKYMALTGIDST